MMIRSLFMLAAACLSTAVFAFRSKADPVGKRQQGAADDIVYGSEMERTP